MIATLYPTLRRWSEKGSVFIISDPHLKDPDRKYMGYDIIEDEQIARLKKRCHKNDTLIVLGDVGDPELFKEIKSHKVLIMGNHDETASKFADYFDEIYTGPLWISEKLVLSHEPISVTSITTGNPVAFNIHGHIHDNRYIDDLHLNLAQNVFGYEPLNLGDFIKEGNLKKLKSIHREIIDDASDRKHRK